MRCQAAIPVLTETSSEWSFHELLRMLTTMNTHLVPMQLSQSNYDPNLLCEPRARYVRFGSDDLDLKHHELFRSGVRVALPRKVFEVLLILIEKPGNVMTRPAARLCRRIRR